MTGVDVFIDGDEKVVADTSRLRNMPCQRVEVRNMSFPIFARKWLNSDDLLIIWTYMAVRIAPQWIVQ